MDRTKKRHEALSPTTPGAVSQTSPPSVWFSPAGGRRMSADELIEEYYREVQFAAKDWFPRDHDISEEAVVILVELAREYVELEDPPDFRAFLFSRMRYRLYDLYRVKYGRSESARERRRKVRQPKPIPFDIDGVDWHPVEPTRPYQQIEDRMWIDHLIDKMTDKERFIVAARIAGWRLNDIAKVFGVTESRISQLRSELQRRIER